MKKLLAVTFLGFSVANCTPAEQRLIITKCLEKCVNGDAGCINACAELLRAECRSK